MKQYELAELAKMSNTFLSDIETGRSAPSIKTLEKIAKVLEIDIKEFFKRTKNVQAIKLQ